MMRWSLVNGPVSKLHEELVKAQPQGGSAVTLGVFDGVHAGHRHLINHLQDAATERGLEPIVVTFINHPRSVVRPDESVVWLTTWEDRLSLLSATGTRVAPVTFTEEVMKLSAEEFLEELWAGLHINHLVVGPDFAMGHEREGTVPVLKKLAISHNFTMEVVPALTLDNALVNSTAIRDALAGGELERASKYLGRHFHLAGEVIRGDGRGGSEFGYPTVNLGLGESQALPADGVYAGWAIVKNIRYKAAISVGVQPTFQMKNPTLVEAYIIDFDEDIYGEIVRLEFAQRLREQECYSDTAQLIAQMGLDVVEVNRIIGDSAIDKTQHVT